MITRRGLIAAAALPLVAADGSGPLLPAAGRLAFDVVRNGSVIGSHVLSFSRVDGGFDIRIVVEIVVRLGPVPLFRYELNGIEQWRDDKVIHVSATTNDDGTSDFIRADRDEWGLWVTGSKAERYLAPGNALPATHWNEAELGGPWINPQDGKLFHPVITPKGIDPAILAGGRSVPARHFDVSGDIKMQLWYDAAHQWTGLLFAARDGSAVRYELR